MEIKQKFHYELIVTIVDKGLSEDVITAAKEAGARGATVLFGRGSGIHERASFFGISIEPEKEVILNIVREDVAEAILLAIGKAINIDKPGTGISFVLDIKRLIGISHLFDLPEEE